MVLYILDINTIKPTIMNKITIIFAILLSSIYFVNAQTTVDTLNIEILRKVSPIMAKTGNVLKFKKRIIGYILSYDPRGYLSVDSFEDKPVNHLTLLLSDNNRTKFKLKITCLNNETETFIIHKKLL